MLESYVLKSQRKQHIRRCLNFSTPTVVQSVFTFSQVQDMSFTSSLADLQTCVNSFSRPGCNYWIAVERNNYCIEFQLENSNVARQRHFSKWKHLECTCTLQIAHCALHITRWMRANEAKRLSSSYSVFLEALLILPFTWNAFFLYHTWGGKKRENRALAVDASFYEWQ